MKVYAIRDEDTGLYLKGRGKYDYKWVPEGFRVFETSHHAMACVRWVPEHKLPVGSVFQIVEFELLEVDPP